MNKIDAIEVPASPARLTLQEKVLRMENVLMRYWDEGLCTVLAFSSGKGSSVMAGIALNLLRKLVGQGALADVGMPRLIVVHSDTRVENPVMSAYAQGECSKIQCFIQEHKLPARVDIVRPNLSNNYLVNLIGGRAVATMPGMGAQCSDMMKVQPINQHKNQLFKEYGRDRVFTMVATRRDESAERAQNMAARGDDAERLVTNEAGHMVLSPMADFTLDDVFMWIGSVRSERISTYSDFTDLVDNYRDMNGGDCMVTVYATGRSGSTGCTARSGCWTCLRVGTDQSMETMVEDPRFSWMKPLSELRNFIGAEHWNPSNRSWLSRTIDSEGNATIAPNAYSPEFTETLLRCVLSIQANEIDRARRAGEDRPRFTLLREEDVIGIAFLWSRYGHHDADKALQIWSDVVVYGNRFPIPSTTTTWRRADFPRFNEKVLFTDGEYRNTAAGFRDVDAAAVMDEVVTVKKGVAYMTTNLADEFTVDAEAACLFLDFDLEHQLESLRSKNPTALSFVLLRMGIVTLRKGSESMQSRMLRMANQIERHGLRPYLNDPDAMLGMLGAIRNSTQPSIVPVQLELCVA